MRKLIFITCSGANEFTNIRDMVSLAETYPIAEFGIQVSGKKCSADSPRYQWIHDLQKYLNEENKIMNLALHLNQDWVEGFTSGKMPQELEELLEMRDAVDEPLFQRIQLNFKIGRDKTPDENVLKSRMELYGQERRFILSYNPENKPFIHRLYRKGVRSFDVLYDSSHGEGILPQEWSEPVFDDRTILQGYAGGLSPDNVRIALEEIEKVIPGNRAFYIDAEGQLKGDDNHLSLEKCAAYIKNALND